jgi:hypothetical protein
MWNNMKKCLLVIVSGLVGKLDGRARKPWITKKLPVKWMKEGNGRMSGTKKEEKTTEDSRTN